jgi:Arylsulfotransferase (ASST)
MPNPLLLSCLLLFSTMGLAQDDPDPEPDPEPQRGLQHKTAAATPGYTLFAPLASHSVVLIDDEGEVAHEWQVETNPGAMVYLRDNGNLVRGGHIKGSGRFEGGGMGGQLQELTWDGELVWEHDLADDGFHQHHDIELMPNGNLLVIGWEYKTRGQVLAAGRDPNAVGEKGLWPDVILELKPTPPRGAEVVWQWHAWDRVIQDFDPKAERYGSIPDHPGKLDINGDHRDQPPVTDVERQRQAKLEAEMAGMGYTGDDDEEETPTEADLRRLRSPDWMHTNAVAYDPELDLIAISSPEFCEVFIIDHSTTSEQAAGSTGGRHGRGGDFLWRWGNPRNYGAGKGRDQKLFYQHDPTWVRGADGAACLLLFNNGRGRRGFSEVLQLELPLANGRFVRRPGAPFGPEQAVWSYADGKDFFGAFISGAQRLAGGNTLVCTGPAGHLFEVTPGGDVVWDYLSPLGGEVQPGESHPDVPAHAIFRAHRYEPDHPALKGRL